MTQVFENMGTLAGAGAVSPAGWGIAALAEALGRGELWKQLMQSSQGLHLSLPHKIRQSVSLQSIVPSQSSSKLLQVSIAEPAKGSQVSPAHIPAVQVSMPILLEHSPTPQVVP